MRRALLAATTALLMTCLPAAGQPQGQWRLSWAEDFDTATLDTTVWSRTTIGRADWNKTQSPDKRLVKFRNGNIVLRGIVNDDTTTHPAPYICGGIISKGKKSFTPPCRIEVRARLHGAKGAWPAIWLMPESNVRWPEGGEIDMMERLNNNHFAYQTVHSHYTQVLGHKDDPPHFATGHIARGDFNVYAVEILHDSVTFFINGKRTLTYPRTDTKLEGQFPFFHPWYMLIDMQLEGSWVGSADPGDLPVEMEVDWVKYYVND